MKSSLIEFLEQQFPVAFNRKWDTEKMIIRREQRSKGKFEIKDKEPKIVQFHGKGVSVINNTAEIPVEIVDFESYIDLLDSADGEIGRKCDFIINPIAGYDFIIFNELTESETQYIKPFVSPSSGEAKEGKLSYAKKQLENSIELFYKVNPVFLERYTRKIALFSCKLTDTKPNNAMAQSIRGFRKPQKIFSNIRANQLLTHGFIFEQRIYNTEYKI